MTFSLIYEMDFKRVMAAVINDAGNTIPATTNQPGQVISDYVDSQVDLIVPGVLVYRIVYNGSNLGGYAAIQVSGGLISLLFYQLRPAFQSFVDEILQEISIFIQGSGPLQDILL